VTAAPWTAPALGERLGLDPTPPAAPLGTGFVGPLLDGGDARVAAALAGFVPDPLPLDPLAWTEGAARALRAWLDSPGPVVFAADAAALGEEGVRTAIAGTGRTAALAIDPLVVRPPSAMPASPVAAAARVTKRDVAAIVLEPRVEDDAGLASLRELVALARAAGTWVIADETRTAGRTHPGSAARALGLECDLVLVGDAVACGRSFAALLARLGAAGIRLSEPAPDALAFALARASATVLARTPVHEDLAACGTRLVQAFESAARREDLRAGFVGPPALARVDFAAQEGVAAPLLRWHFDAEMQRLGAVPSEWCVAHAWTPQVEARLAAALAATAGRLRTKLIESNSYLSGGLPWVFATGDEVLRQRGLARYRYPKLAAVAVDAEPAGVRIAFAPGPLGPVVSSGFFVPTHLRGDFSVEIDYALPRWSSGPDSACFGLFFQNDLSTGRYYAQRTRSAAGDDTVLGSFDGHLTPSVPVRAARGALRLVRQGRTVTAWHREDQDEWRELGRTDAATADDGIVGAKVWSKVSCDGLEAEVTALRLHATVAEGQGPPVPVRPDPRRR